MNMASRNIANMHLFLEMKKKFPDLPEDTLRNYVLLYAKDQEKCVNLLQQESKTHFHTSQPFSDFHLFENRAFHKKSDTVKDVLDPVQEHSSVSFHPNTNSAGIEPAKKWEQLTSPQESVMSTSYASLPIRSPKTNVPLKPKIQSAPVIPSYDNPFSEACKPVSSHTVLCQLPSDHDDRMMFSTTKEHTILPLELPGRIDPPRVPEPRDEVKPSKRHAVSLSITPSFPFVQQQMNVYSSAVSAATSHSSKPGRHTTSLNLQLQPYSSDPYPLEISTIPTNIGSPSNSNDFGSHLHISVGSQGATFTALRLQRPQVAQGQLPVSGEASFKFSQSSSQVQNSKIHKFPTHLKISSPTLEDKNAGVVDGGDFSDITLKTKTHSNYSQNSGPQLSPEQKLSAQTSFGHGFQASPDYMQAVKKHQLSQLDLVQKELLKEKSICSNLKFEVNKLEQELVQRREKENSSSYIEILKKMKEENRKLRIECNCLLMEYDLHSKGQIPVGMTDEDFYSNLFTGPSDNLFCSSDEEKDIKNDNLTPEVRVRSSTVEEDDEKNRWLCKKCTFANHPALDKCEMCELPRNTDSFFDMDNN